MKNLFITVIKEKQKYYLFWLLPKFELNCSQKFLQLHPEKDEFPWFARDQYLLLLLSQDISTLTVEKRFGSSKLNARISEQVKNAVAS